MITDEQFYEIWDNENNHKAMNLACSKFPLMTPDEHENCKMHAVLTVGKKWFSDNNTYTLSTLLYKATIWELQSLYQSNKPEYSKEGYKEFVKNEGKGRVIEETIEGLSVPEKELLLKSLPDMVIDRYLKKMTLKEMSKKYNYCTQWISILTQNAVEEWNEKLK